MDEKLIYSLIEKFDESTLTELKISTNGEKIEMKKGGEFATPLLPSQVIAPQPTLQTASAPAAPEGSAPQLSAPGAEAVTSPLVGTFYRSPSPDSPPYVEVGSRVNKGETLCILEAMKTMNELEAEFDCEVVAILLESGVMAEFGTPLFEVKRL